MNVPVSGMLRITSILFIIFGGIAAIEMFILMDSVLSLRNTAAALIGLYVLAMCIAEFILGIAGAIKCGNPVKADFFIRSGIVLLILCGVNILRLIFAGGFQITYLIGLVLSVLFIAGGIMRKKSMRLTDAASAPKPKARIPAAIAIIVTAVLAAVFAGLPLINQSLTILSLKKLDNYPLYSIAYYGEYNLNYEVPNPKIPVVDSLQCTSFLAFNGKGEPMLCRNLDNALAYHPIAMLTTNAPGKCATISITDLYYLGYSGDRQPSGSVTKDRALLEAPRIVIDGMNEYGVAFAVLDVPYADPPADPGKKSVDHTAMMRLALDGVKNVDQAVEMIKSYNVVLTRPIHFMIADAGGDSAIIEFVNGEVVVTKKSDPWQAVTNFIVSSQDQEGEGQDRYKTAQDELRSKNGSLSEDEAMALLKKVARSGTHWSVIYNLKTGEVRLALAQNYKNILKFKMQMHP